MYTYEVESLELKKPPVELSQSLNVLFPSQNVLAPKDVWFLDNDGQRLWFCAGVPTPTKDPYWKLSVKWVTLLWIST
jgi:hypothetical protein